MTRKETVKNLLTELIDMIDNGSQKDLDRADEISASIIKLFEQDPIIDKIAEIIEPLRQLSLDEMSNIEWQVLRTIDKYKIERNNEK